MSRPPGTHRRWIIWEIKNSEGPSENFKPVVYRPLATFNLLENLIAPEIGNSFKLLVC